MYEATQTWVKTPVQSEQWLVPPRHTREKQHLRFSLIRCSRHSRLLVEVPPERVRTVPLFVPPLSEKWG